MYLFLIVTTLAFFLSLLKLIFLSRDYAICEIVVVLKIVFINLLLHLPHNLFLGFHPDNMNEIGAQESL